MKTGVAPAAASSQPAGASPAADAFSMLVQALGDAANPDANLAGDTGSGNQDPTQAPSKASLLNTAPTTGAANSAAQPADGKTATGDKGDASSGNTPATAAADPAAAASATDPAALAAIAAAMNVAPTQTPVPAQPQADTLLSAGGAAAISGAGVGPKSGAADPAAAGATTPAEGDAAAQVQPQAQGQAQGQAPGAQPQSAQGATQGNPAATAQAATAAPTLADAAAALQSAQAAQPAAPAVADAAKALAQAQRGSAKAAGATDANAKSAATAAANSAGSTGAQSKNAAATPGTDARVGHDERHAGLTKQASSDLPPAPSDSSNAAQQGQQQDGDSSQSAASAVPVVDGAQSQAATANAAATNAGFTIAAAPAGAVAGTSPAAPGRLDAAGAATADPQTLALTPRNAALAASAVAQVNVLLQRAGLSRADSLTVRLDPAELGRVEVKLKIEKNGPVHASVTADRPQTLDMLRNDRGALEKALQSAGLNTDSGSLSFNLRDNNGSGQQTGAGAGRGARAIADDSAAGGKQFDLVAATNGWTEAGRLDLRV